MLLFAPIYQERIWGGDRIDGAFARSLGTGRVIGESWEIVDRVGVQSRVIEGRWATRTLREILIEDAEAIMGPGWDPARRFPILVKWLDCRKRLSLQVHPPAPVATRLHGEPKTEFWYVREASEGAGVYAGLRHDVGTEALVDAALGNSAAAVERCLRRFDLRRHDSLLVEAGVVHAIDGGSLLLEIQQNSDTTYRLYDWGHTDDAGRQRPLHVEAARESIIEDAAPEIAYATGDLEVLAECPAFRITRRSIRTGEETVVGVDGQPRIVSIIEGRTVSDDGTVLRKGDNALLTYAERPKLQAIVPTILLVTDRFTVA